MNGREVFGPPAQIKGATQMQGFRWHAYWNATFYTSSTALIADSDTGIIATPLVPVSGYPPIFPLYFLAISNGIAGAETNDVSIAWYADAAGASGIIGTTTFNQFTLGAPNDLELWPGDVTAFAAGLVGAPLLPYCKIIWDVSAGSSSGFVLYLTYLAEENK